MLERVLAVILIVTSIVLTYRLAQRMLLRRRAARGLGLTGYRLGRPAILYFTAPGCVPCKTIQQPALRSLATEYGDAVQIFEVDAVENRTLANQWAVLSVPTTFIIDSLGRPRKINHRALPSEKLVAQLEQIGENLTAQPRSGSNAVSVLK